jgi:hypothetical protein
MFSKKEMKKFLKFLDNIWEKNKVNIIIIVERNE